MHWTSVLFSRPGPWLQQLKIPTPAVKKLVPQLKVEVKHEPRRMRNPEGPLGRLKQLRKTVTALIKHERIELNYNRGHESRAYTERLISEAVKNGDCHKETMELADFWLEEKQLIHKLFKVLAPRYRNYSTSYTRFMMAPSVYPGDPTRTRCIMELKGHPFPPVVVDFVPRRNQLHNILLEEARNEFQQEKQIEKPVSNTETVSSTTSPSPAAAESADIVEENTEPKR